MVVERQYPADAGRVRELLMNLNNLKIVERKTSDPANYAKLGVENPDTPTAASTLVEVVAGQKTWSLIVGKNAAAGAVYARKPGEAASALVEPAVTVDPDQKRWIDRQLTDIPGADVHEIAVKPASGPAYTLTRAKRNDPDLVLDPIPKGRTQASNMSINGQADTLTAFTFDDLRTVPATPATRVDRATFRTFDGEVLEFTGHRDADKAYVSVSASRDAALAARFQEAPAPKAAEVAAGKPADGAAAAAPAPAAATPAAAQKRTDVERLTTRARGVEFEIPVYKYESLFKPHEDLLEQKPGPQADK
jgi:hypothetical protein